MIKVSRRTVVEQIPPARKCLCGGSNYELNRDDQFWYCRDCKRCTGRCGADVWGFWPVFRCYHCGCTCCFLRDKGRPSWTWYCYLCNAYQFDEEWMVEGFYSLKLAGLEDFEL